MCTNIFFPRATNIFLLLFFYSLPLYAGLLSIAGDNRKIILENLSWIDKFNLSLACKGYSSIRPNNMVEYLNNLYPGYRDGVCILLDRVYHGDTDAVEFLLSQLQYTSLVFHPGLFSFPIFLRPIEIALYTKNQCMINLLKKEEEKQSLSNSINYELCLLSCCGDIHAFNEAMEKKKTKHVNKETAFLVIWAAVKNNDLDFLKNLLQYPVYAVPMKRNADDFVWWAALGNFKFESFSKIKNQLSQAYIKRFTTLIQSDCFSIFSDRNMTIEDYRFNFSEYNIQGLSEIMKALEDKNREIKRSETLRKIGVISGCVVVLIGIWYIGNYLSDKS